MLQKDEIGLEWTRCLWHVAVAVLAVACLFTSAYAALLLTARLPLPGEGEILHEASRIRQHLPLYTTPLVGAFDYGPYPSRAYVLYLPLWSWTLSQIPGAFTFVVGRVVGLTSWLGALVMIVRSAPAARRRHAAIAALFVCGVHLLVPFATCARPDAVAVSIAALATSCSLRRNRVGAWEGALFMLAAVLKPNVFGLGAGTTLATLTGAPFVGREVTRRALTVIAGAVVVIAPAFIVLSWVSQGAFLDHLESSVGQAFRLDVWWQQCSRRVLFLGPIALVLFTGLRAAPRNPRALTATFAFGASVAWAIFALAKVGSASNYWMEAAVGAVIVFAYAPLPSLSPRGAAVLALLALTHAVWLLLLSASGVLEAIEKVPARVALVERARRTCRLDPSQVVLSDSSGVEYLANDRVLAPFFQTVMLMSAGRYPVSTWIADVERPEATCFVTEGDLPHLHDPSIHELLTQKFVLEAEAADFRLYRARAR